MHLSHVGTQSTQETPAHTTSSRHTQAGSHTHARTAIRQPTTLKRMMRSITIALICRHTNTHHSVHGQDKANAELGWDPDFGEFGQPFLRVRLMCDVVAGEEITATRPGTRTSGTASAGTVPTWSRTPRRNADAQSTSTPSDRLKSSVFEV